MATQSQVRIGWKPYVNLTTATYLLDTYTGANNAFSLRKLNGAYSGSAIRVRRSGDNIEQNIGFNANGDLNTNSLLDFIGYTNFFTAVTPGASNNLADANWLANGITKTANLPDAPTGATSSNKMTETATNVQHFLSYSIISGTIDTHNVSAYLKKGTGSAAPDRIAISVGNAAYGMWAIFNLSTGVIETQVPGTATSFQVAMTNAGNGWWRCSVGGDLNYTTNQVIRTSVQFCNNSASYNPFTTSYMGNVNADVLVANLQWIKEAGLQRYGVSGGGNGFVTTWFDQVGTSNLVQTTAANQPQIVSMGSVVTSNGKPAIFYDGTNDQFNAAVITIGSDVTGTNVNGKPSTVFSVFDINSAYSTTNEYPIFGGTSHYSSRFSINANKYFIINNTTTVGASSTVSATTGTKLGTVLFNNLNDLIRINGVEVVNASVGNAGNSGNYIGRSWLGKFFYGKISEVVVYSVLDKSTSFAGIESNINSYYSLWDIVQSGLVLNLDAGIISSYPGTGSTWTDISGNSNNGTLTNSPIFGTANGGLITFDGVNDYVDFGNNTTLYNASDSAFTQEFAIRLKSNAATDKTIFRVDDWSRIWTQISTSQFKFIIGYNNPIDTLIYNGTFAYNQWYIITTVWSKLNTQKIYINGVLVAQRTPSVSSYTGVTGTVGGANIGRGHSDPYANYLNFDMSIFRHYNKVLTDTEILQNFNATKSRFGL